MQKRQIEIAKSSCFRRLIMIRIREFLELDYTESKSDG